MSEEVKNIRLVSLQDIEVPKAVAIVGRKRWVDYGEDNLYPQFLRYLYNGSPTNNAIVTTISQLIYGEGLKVVGGDVVNQQLLDKIVKEEDARQAAFDLKAFGYSVLFVKTDGKKIKSITTSSAKLWRSGTKDEKGKVSEWYYSEDWSKYSHARFKPNPYPVYDKFSTDKEMVYIVRPFISADEYYPSVSYEGGIDYILVEIEVGSFHISNLANGMFPGLLVNFNNGVPSEDVQDNIELGLKQKWGGAKKAGKIVVSFNDHKDSATTIEPIQQTDLDKMFEFLSKEATQKIIIAHRVTSPMLLGIRDATGLGNNADELRQAYQLFAKMVVAPYQNILTSAYSSLLERNEKVLDLEFEPLILVDDEMENTIEEPETASPEKKPIISSSLKPEELVEHNDQGFDEKVYNVYYKPQNWRGQDLTKNVFHLSEAQLVNDAMDRQEVSWKRLVYLKTQE